jgi:hypothetical protein
MDFEKEQELANNLAKDIYAVLKKNNLSYHESFLVLAATTAAIGNDDEMEEEYMLSILKSAIQADKQMQRMELQ